MNGKKWIKSWLIIITSCIPIIGVFNYIIDPHWSFGHTNQLNAKQLSFNERQQKTNNVFFNGLEKFDGILFGSSRTTFINQNDFHNMNIYNYAIDSMYPFEYEEYLHLAKESKTNEFKYIIIGADFYNSMKRRIKRFENPTHYIENTKSIFYRYRMLLSIDTLKKSINNIKINLSQTLGIYYSRDNIKNRPTVSEEERLERYTKNLKRHTESFVGSNYKSNPEYIKMLKKLKKENPNTKFIIFTSPITADLLVSVIKNGKKIDEFEKWLNTLIEVFGEVHHFMTINTITKDLQNYPDDDHCYPHIAKLLANKVSSKENKEIPSDFGILLNKSNINEYMNVFKEQLKHYNNPLILER